MATVMTHQTCLRLYEQLIAESFPMPVNPLPLKICEQMHVLADAIEEFEDLELSHVSLAFHYAADHGRWPYVRYKKGLWGTYDSSLANNAPYVYDWNGEHRKGKLNEKIPEYSLLPKHVFQTITWLPRRRYGGIYEAFVLLGRSLVGEVNAPPVEEDEPEYIYINPQWIYDPII